MMAERLGFELLQGYAVGRPQVLSAVALVAVAAAPPGVAR